MMLQSVSRFIDNILVNIKYLLSNKHFFICFGLAWMITNGWAYICLYIAIKINCDWLFSLSSGYLAFIWLPCTPEKLITIPICAFLLKIFYPNDLKALKLLNKKT